MDGLEGRAKWEQHVIAARAAGKSLSRYARDHGIGSWSLYKAQRRMRKRTEGALHPEISEGDCGRFAKVCIAPLTPALLRAQLPNGVRIELANDDSLADVLRILAQLSCSA